LSQELHVDVSAFEKASSGRGIVCDGGKGLIKLVRKGCGHLTHQGHSISMRHFLALDLNLKRSLFLRTHIKCYANRLQEVSVLIPQTASAHDYPTRLAVRQQKAVLALERSTQGARTIVVSFDRSSFVGMNP